MQNPYVSFQTRDAVLDTSFFSTVLLVGQSNVAPQGLYQGLELQTIAQINTTFGADSHIAFMLREQLQFASNSLVKPKVWAVSYPDRSAAVARVLNLTVTGTATENRTLTLNINKLNPDRTTSQAIAVLALRNTKNANCGRYAANRIETGLQNRAAMGFNPILVDAFSQDVLVTVDVVKGDTAVTIAANINAAVNAAVTSVYSSVISDVTNILDFTAKDKGVIGNSCAVEVVMGSTPAGTTISILEDTPGTGTIDTSDILNTLDANGNKLGSLDFDFLVQPYSYATPILVQDAYAKRENVFAYSNRCLNYQIFTGTAVDTSVSENIDDLATVDPIEELGVVKSLFVSTLNGLIIKGVSEVSERLQLAAKQFTALQVDPTTGNINVGNCYTLSNSPGFVQIERELAAMAVRAFIVEKMMPTDFQEESWTDGVPVVPFALGKDTVIALFESYFAILSGANQLTIYQADYAGLIDNSPESEAVRNELLTATVAFDKSNKLLSLQSISALLNKIESVSIVSSYN